MSEVDPKAVVDDIASGPAEMANDSGKVKSQSLKDAMEWESKRTANTAASKAHRGIRRTKLISPGSLDA